MRVKHVHVLIMAALLSLVKHMKSACIYDNPYANKLTLSPTQLTQYKLTDECAYTCNTGYYGDFCETVLNQQQVSRGPWNARGYYTENSVLKEMTISITDLTQVQYSWSDSILLGLNQAGYSSSGLIEISLYTFTKKTVLTGTLSALQVRNGIAFVAQGATPGPYNIATYTRTTGQAYTWMPIPEKAFKIEISLDKGMNTSFVYTYSSKLLLCYPNGTYTTWDNSVNGITGMACGIDCPNSLYVTVGNTLKKYVGAVSTVLFTTQSSFFNCMASIPSLNTIIFRHNTFLTQLSLTGGPGQTPIYTDLLTLPTNIAVCSMDASDSNAQFMLIESGIIKTLSALQKRCSYKQTSLAIKSTNVSYCTDCPIPPTNAYHVIDSVTCEWLCSTGYKKLGGKCVSPLATPCSQFYRYSNGVCIPSVLPWAASGKYVTGLVADTVRSITPANSAPYVLAAAKDSSYMYLAASGGIYRSISNVFEGGQITLSGPAIPTTVCSSTSYSRDPHYISHQDGILWIGYKTRSLTKYCLWAVNTTAPNLGKIIQFWDVGAKVCSVVDVENSDTVYVLFCGANYIMKSSTKSSALSLMAGNLGPGYVDGDLISSKFNAPSSMVTHNSLLYVTDQGNCLIREIDVLRDTVYTVSGLPGICERSDSDSSSGKATVVYPRSLIYTPYDGYFLFADMYSSETSITVRQFHAPTSTIKTIARATQSDTTSLLFFSDKIMIFSQQTYYTLASSSATCPNGTMAVTGGALSQDACTLCPSGQYTPSGGSCLACTTPTCTSPGQIVVACTSTKNSYCGLCTNKPATGAVYTGPGDTETGECPWAYTSPCPIGLYLNSSLGYCVNCPSWSTTTATGRTSISQCVCLAGGAFVSGSCVIPSPYSPSGLYSTLNSALSILGSQCSYTSIDEPSNICPCQPGEYISQIYPKICSACPSGLYSASGIYCQACPTYQEPSLDLSACRCTKGSTDIGLSVLTPQCYCTIGQWFGTVTGCASCPQNTFKSDMTLVNANTATTLCTACAAGTYSETGSSTCLACPYGTYRETWRDKCTECSPGYYATKPTTGALCTACVSSCQGAKQSACPTKSTNPSLLYTCSECPPIRANSFPNGKDDCATDCQPGYYDREGVCTACRTFSSSTCSAGYIHTACGKYTDADCAACFNVTKPIYYSEWSLVPSYPSGPNSMCNWKCQAGYTARSAKWVDASSLEWECVEDGSWSLWNLFTL